MGLREMLRTALGALRAHKMRSSLSVLGIVIGVAAVVAIIALVNGATAEVKAQIAGLGMRTINIYIFPQAISSASSVRALTQELTEDLLKSVDCVLLSTDHSAYNYQWIHQHSQLIIDTRNAFKEFTEGKIIKA